MRVWLWLIIGAGLSASAFGSTTVAVWAHGATYVDPANRDTISTSGFGDMLIGSQSGEYIGIIILDADGMPAIGSTIEAVSLIMQYKSGPGFVSDDVTITPTGVIFDITECTYNSASTGVP
jgi:hypothetical protein